MKNLNRCFSTVSSFYANQAVEKYASAATKKVTLRQLIAFGRHMNEHKLIKSAGLVRDELIVRLDFQKLPYIVGTNPRIELAYNSYCDAFDCFRKMPKISTLKDNEAFCKTLETLLKNHLIVIPSLAGGMAECNRFISAEQMDKFMNDVLRTRIGRRVLAEQHIALSRQFMENTVIQPNLIGIIDSKCKVKEIIEKCSNLAKNAIRDEIGVSIKKMPEINAHGDLEATFMYIPDHIEYMIFELMKNSLRHQIINTIESPIDIWAIASNSGKSRTITFRISDQGLGFNKTVLPPDSPGKLWSFSHQFEGISNGFVMGNETIEIAGKVSDTFESRKRFRIGLQLARVFAKYWSGDVQVHTMYGYGSDVYIKLDTTGEGSERLTVENDDE